MAQQHSTNQNIYIIVSNYKEISGMKINQFFLQNWSALFGRLRYFYDFHSVPTLFFLVVTGATDGIGKAVAKQVFFLSSHLLINYLNLQSNKQNHETFLIIYTICYYIYFYIVIIIFWKSILNIF